MMCWGSALALPSTDWLRASLLAASITNTLCPQSANPGQLWDEQNSLASRENDVRNSHKEERHNTGFCENVINP